MAIYGSTSCDSSATFTGLVTSGDGTAGFDNVNEREGTACFYTEMDNTAGYAYGYVDLATAIGDGDYFHIGGWMWFARDWDFATPSTPMLSSAMACVRLYDTVGGKVLYLNITATVGAGGEFEWRMATNAGVAAGSNFDPGWWRGVWRYIDIYGYVHNTDGWFQCWEDGTKHLEVTGADTYPGNAWDRLTLGSTSESNPANDICFVFDDFIVDDEASPSPPAGYGGGYGSPLRRGLIAPFYNDQRNARGQTAKWPATREWQH